MSCKPEDARHLPPYGTVPDHFVSLPHAAVVAIEHGHGVTQIAHLYVLPGQLRLRSDDTTWITIPTTEVRAPGRGGRLIVGTGTGALAMVVVGERDLGRYAPAGTIVESSLWRRIWLALAAGDAAERRRERRLARCRLIALFQRSQDTGATRPQT